MPRREPIRVYLRHDGFVRAFYWVGVGRDGSIYSGTSVTDFKRAGHQSLDLSAEGDGPRIEMDYERLDKIEVGGKHSIHASGLTLGSKQENGRRIERQLKPLAQHHGCIPVVGVLPMVPLIYPRTQKKLRDSDIVLDTEKFQGVPFAFLLYLQGISDPDALVLQKYRESGHCVEGASELPDFIVRAALYTDPAKFIKWPNKQVEVVARGQGEQPILQFPMFTTSPQ